MANTNAGNGFKPSRHLMGGVIRPGGNYKIASATASNIFTGDVVKLLTTGYIDKAAAGDTSLIGIFAGCQYTASDGSAVFSAYWPTGVVTQGSADVVAYVYDDPNIAYEVQCLTGTNYALAMNGANADFSYVAGSTATGRSASVLDVSSVGTGTANFRILDMINRPENALGDSARVEVKFNEHQLFSTTGI